MKAAVFHPGTQHSWQTATALQQLGCLEWYATSIFHDPGRWPYRLERYLPPPLARRVGVEFRRFRHDALDPALVRTAGLFEWFERAAARMGAGGLARRLDRIGNRRFAGLLAREIASPHPFALWGYDGSSLETFRMGRTHGRHCILDRTIGDMRAYRAAMEPLRQSHAQWFLPGAAQVDDAAIERADAEYEAADTILVGSDFAARTIRDHAAGGAEVAARLRVLPYCHDEDLFGSLPAPAPMRRDEPLRFLFVGHLSPRKGIQHVLEAFSRIPPAAASLTLVGDMAIPRTAFAPHAQRVTWLPTVPRSAVPAIMAAHHVLLFPSHFEGAAITVHEALASGMGVIQSRQAGDAGTEQTGIILEQVSGETVHDAMLQAIDARDRVEGWRNAAQARARLFSFEQYRDNIAALLRSLDG